MHIDTRMHKGALMRLPTSLISSTVFILLAVSIWNSVLPDYAQAQDCLDYKDHPRMLGGVDTPGDAQDVVLYNDLAYLSDSVAGLLTIDVSDPVQPVLLQPVACLGDRTVSSLALSGDLLLVFTTTPQYQYELAIIDLSAPLEPSLADEVSTQVVVKSIGMLKRMFDYIVIDTAPFLDEPVLSILERSDVVLLVVDMDLPAVKNAKLALDTLRLIKFPFEKMKLVLNRVNSKARLDIGELERSLGLDVQAAVSSDKLVPRAVNEGEPVVSLYPRSRVARDLRGVAQLALDESDQVEDAEGEAAKRRWFR